MQVAVGVHMWAWRVARVETSTGPVGALFQVGLATSVYIF